MSLFFAVALSIDALGMGVSCGLRKLKIGVSTYILLFWVSALVMGVAVFFGDILASFFEPRLAEIVASIWIAALGIFIALSALTKKQDEAQLPKGITKWGAVQLGLILSLDSMGAGLAAASLGIAVYALPFLVALFQIIFLAIGISIANHLNQKSANTKLWNVLSGLILVIIGIIGFVS